MCGHSADEAPVAQGTTPTFPASPGFAADQLPARQAPPPYPPQAPPGQYGAQSGPYAGQLPRTAGPRRFRFMVLAVATIGALGLAAIAALLLLRGSDDGTSKPTAADLAAKSATATPTPGSRRTVVAGVIEVTVQDGWQVKETSDGVTRGIVMVLDPADFDRQVPLKSRIKIQYVLNAPGSALREVLIGLTPASSDVNTAVGPPFDLKSGEGAAYSAIERTVQGKLPSPFKATYVAVASDPTDRGKVVLFTAEEPVTNKGEAESHMTWMLMHAVFK